MSLAVSANLAAHRESSIVAVALLPSIQKSFDGLHKAFRGIGMHPVGGFGELDNLSIGKQFADGLAVAILDVIGPTCSDKTGWT